MRSYLADDSGGGTKIFRKPKVIEILNLQDGIMHKEYMFQWAVS